MTKDDIIRIYSQVSDELCNGTEWCWAGVGEPLQRFAELIAAAEREACALAAEAVVPRHTECGNKIAAAIRARGRE